MDTKNRSFKQLAGGGGKGEEVDEPEGEGRTGEWKSKREGQTRRRGKAVGRERRRSVQAIGRGSYLWNGKKKRWKIKRG